MNKTDYFFRYIQRVLKKNSKVESKRTQTSFTTFCIVLAIVWMVLEIKKNVYMHKIIIPESKQKNKRDYHKFVQLRLTREF